MGRHAGTPCFQMEGAGCALCCGCTEAPVGASVSVFFL